MVGGHHHRRWFIDVVPEKKAVSTSLKMDASFIEEFTRRMEQMNRRMDGEEEKRIEEGQPMTKITWSKVKPNIKKTGSE